MDYCSSCRRHLNGALVCPGCGAYAPDIAPVGVSRYTTVQPRPTMAAASPAVAGPAEVPKPEAAAGAGAGADPDFGPDPDPYDGFEGATPAPQGRAARRRQRVRWKKNQRRAVVATAVALVGGGLTFTALDRLSADRAEAASAPETAGGPGSAEEDASRHTGPSSTRPDDQRSSAAPSTQSPANGRPDRRAAAAPTSVTPQGSRPDTVPTPSTTSASTSASTSTSTSTSASDHRSRNASSSSSGDAAGAASSQPSTPAATGGSGDSGTSPASPDPTATSPSQLCLLVVCIG
jgi:hypothetical protein